MTVSGGKVFIWCRRHLRSLFKLMVLVRSEKKEFYPLGHIFFLVMSSYEGVLGSTLDIVELLDTYLVSVGVGACARFLALAPLMRGNSEETAQYIVCI